MSNKAFIAFTTYRKYPAALTFLRSLLNNGYAENNTICIADDNGGHPYNGEPSAIDLYNEFKAEIPDLILCHGIGRNGIGANKNRAIKAFRDRLKKGENYKDFLIFDDDMEMYKPGLLNEFREASLQDKQKHINGYWERSGLNLAFPVRQTTERTSFHTGCQGVALYFTKDLIEELGFFPVYKGGLYGYEHSNLSSRAMMLQGYCPDLYPSLIRFGRYVRPQNIPNRYEIASEKLHANSPEFWAGMQRIRAGLDLTINETGLPRKGECAINSSNSLKGQK